MLFHGGIQGSKDAPVPRPNKRPRLGPSPSEESSPPHHSATSQKSKNDGKTSKITKGQGPAQLDEYMQVMQSRAKKGPSWINEAQAQSELTSPAAVKLSKPKFIEKVKQPPAEEPVGDAQEECISDLDWMRQRISQHVDSTDVGLEKVFEQSDEEVEAPAEVRLFYIIVLHTYL